MFSLPPLILLFSFLTHNIDLPQVISPPHLEVAVHDGYLSHVQVGHTRRHVRGNPGLDAGALPPPNPPAPVNLLTSVDRRVVVVKLGKRTYSSYTQTRRVLYWGIR